MTEIILELFGLGGDVLNRARNFHARVIARTLLITILAIFAGYGIKVGLGSWGIAIDTILSIFLLAAGLIIITRPEALAATAGWGVISGTLKSPETIGEETKRAFKFVYVLAGKVLFFLSFIFFLIGTFPIPITFTLFCIILAGGLLIAWGIISWNIPGERFRNAAFAYIGIVIACGIISQGWNYAFHTETSSAVEEIQAKQKEMETEDNLKALAYLEKKIENARAVTDEQVRAALTNGEYNFWNKMEKRSLIKNSVSVISSDISGLPPGAKKILFYAAILGLLATFVTGAKKIFGAVMGGKTTAPTTVMAAATKKEAAKSSGSVIMKVLGVILIVFLLFFAFQVYTEWQEKYGKWQTVGRFDFSPFKWDTRDGNWQSFAVELGWTYRIHWYGNYEALDYGQSSNGSYGSYMRTVDPQRGIPEEFRCAITEHAPDKIHRRGMLIGKSGSQSIENGVPFTPETTEASFAINVPMDWSGNCKGEEFLSPEDNFVHNRGKITIVVERARQ